MELSQISVRQFEPSAISLSTPDFGDLAPRLDDLNKNAFERQRLRIPWMTRHVPPPSAERSLNK